MAGLEGDGRESSRAGCGQHPRFSKCFVVLLTAGLRGDGRESSVAGCGLTFMLGHADCFYLLDSLQAGGASLPNNPEAEKHEPESALIDQPLLINLY